MYKAVGNNLILKVVKKKSALDLSAMSNAGISEESVAVVESLGTKCSLGVEVGHEVIVKSNTMPIIVEETEEHDLLLIPETSIAYIKNYEV